MADSKEALPSLRTTLKAKRKTSTAMAIIIALPLVLSRNSDILSHGFEDNGKVIGRLLGFAGEVCSEVDIQKFVDDLLKASISTVSTWALEAVAAISELQREHDSYKSRKDSFYSLYVEQKRAVEQLGLNVKRLRSAHQDELNQQNSKWTEQVKRLAELAELETASRKRLEQQIEEWQAEKAKLVGEEELHRQANEQLRNEVEALRGRVLAEQTATTSSAAELSTKELEKAQQKISKQRAAEQRVAEQRIAEQRIAELTTSLAVSTQRIEDLMADLAQCRQEVTKLKNQLSASRTEDVAAIVKENRNLRTAVKFLEKAKADKDNEIVAVRFQLTEYQRKYGAFGPTHYFDSTHSTVTRDGVIRRAELPKKDRRCPICHVDFSKEKEVAFIAHVKECISFETI